MSRTKLYIENIKAKYPDLLIEEYFHNQEGQNNDVLIVNKELVFRFPKYENGIHELQKETAFLIKIQNHMSLKIPNPTYISLNNKPVGEAFVGYRLIKGQPLKKELFDTINEKENLATDLANFLKELHTLDIKQTLGLDDGSVDYYEKWNSLFIRIKEELFPYMRKEARYSVEKNFEDYLLNKENFNFHPTIIHGDFGPTNILYDKESRKISGVIDFGSVAVGDPASDLASLIGPFGYGESFLELFSSVYPDTKLLLERARFYSSTFALQEALFGIENNDKEAFN